MKKYIAIFEVPDDHTPAKYISNADGYFAESNGEKYAVGSTLIALTDETLAKLREEGDE